MRASATIVNPQGLHARPISLIVRTVMQHKCPVQVVGPEGGPPVDGGSAFSLMTLAAGQGSELVFEADGEGADAVLEDLVALVARGFDEM